MIAKVLEKIRSKKNVLSDFLLNFVASFATTGVMQLLLYPWLSKVFNANEYGVILTVMGIMNTITGTIGGSLNNTRLLVESEYEKKEKRGDFLPLLMLGNLSGVLITIAYLQHQRNMNSAVMAGLVFFVVMASLRNYGSVYFRISLEYKKNLVCSLLIAGGNLAGFFLLYVTTIKSLWVLSFLIGEVIGVIYVCYSSDMIRERFIITHKIKAILKIEIAILLTTLISNMLTYLDRLILLPVLGGEAVSTYTVAAFLGKSFGVVMTPLAGVLLSYYAQKQYVMNIKKFWKINFLMIGISIPFMGVCFVASDFVTGLFYPTLIDGARDYLLLANTSAIINVTAAMTQPAILKFAKVYWQVIIQTLYAILYLGFGFMGARINGLQGFTIGALIAAIGRLFILYVVGSASLKVKSKGGQL